MEFIEELDQAIELEKNAYELRAMRKIMEEEIERLNHTKYDLPEAPENKTVAPQPPVKPDMTMHTFMTKKITLLIALIVALVVVVVFHKSLPTIVYFGLVILIVLGLVVFLKLKKIEQQEMIEKHASQEQYHSQDTKYQHELEIYHQKMKRYEEEMEHYERECEVIKNRNNGIDLVIKETENKLKRLNRFEENKALEDYYSRHDIPSQYRNLSSLLFLRGFRDPESAFHQLDELHLSDQLEVNVDRVSKLGIYVSRMNTEIEKGKHAFEDFYLKMEKSFGKKNV